MAKSDPCKFCGLTLKQGTCKRESFAKTCGFYQDLQRLQGKKVRHEDRT